MNIKKISQYVKYEIDMFRFTANYLTQPNLPQDIKNVFIESFVIHSRNLFYFFYTEKRNNKDDILAIDFDIKRKAFKTQRTKKVLLNYIPKRVNKLAAHITTHRAIYNKKTKPWKIYDIKDKMEQTINAYINALSKEQKNWFT